MPIASTFPLPAGNAVQLVVQMPAGAVRYRVLRRPVDSFTGPTDPAATLAADDVTFGDVVDITGLVNGVTYYYRVYYRDAAGAWMDVVDSAVATPAATYSGGPLDVQTIVRERLELGLAEEVRRGVLKPKTGKIDVLLAPFALADGNFAFPTVSVHLEHEVPEYRVLGETLAPDTHKPDGGWTETMGWLARTTLNVVGVSLNPTERVTLRRAIARIMRTNIPIFSSRDMNMIEFSQRDHEDTDAYQAPLYFTLGTFSCTAPAWVTDDLGEIEEVQVSSFDIKL